MYSSDEDTDVKGVRVPDRGSHPQGAWVDVQGVPACGMLVSGADISIMVGAFCKVVAVAKLKTELQRSDKTPRNYDQTPFTLDGWQKLDVLFAGTTMHTPVYVKMDAPDQLLLSEGFCRQLGLMFYHPSMVQLKGGKQAKKQ